LTIYLFRVGSDYQGAAVEREDPRKLFAGSDLGKSTSTLSSIFTTDNNLDSVPELVGVKLLLNQIAAMFLKRALYSVRNWILLFLQNLIPIVFLIITVYIVRAWGNNDDLPELHLTLDQYSPTVTVLQRDVDLNPSELLGRVIENYRSLFDTRINTLEDIGGLSLMNRILDLSRQMQSRVDTQYIVGASMQRDNITAWFNNQPYHGAPISVNLVHNAILRTMCGTSACGMDVTNKPLPFHPDTRVGH
jgi:ATP-binding cassette, subfamily A (ABC1), member 3